MHTEPVIVVQLQWKWIELRREEARKAKVARVARMAKVAKVTGVFLGELAVVLEAVDADKEKARKAKAVEMPTKAKESRKVRREEARPKTKERLDKTSANCALHMATSGECPNKMDVNYVAQGQNSNGFEATMNPASQHTGTASSSTTYVQQPPVQPQSSTKGTVRRIFHINPSSPSPPTSPISSGSQKHVRMVLLEEFPEEFENMELVTQRVETQDGEGWIILDSGSDVSLLPSRFSADHGTQSNHSLGNCQGGALRTRGTRNADLEVRSIEGENIFLRHQFIIGDVTTGLVSLGQLYQAGWKICGDGDELVLTDPNDEVNIPVHFRNKSFAIRVHVRAAEAGQELDDALEVRAVVAIYDEVENEEINSWGTTSDGGPFYKTMGSNYVDPRPVWGRHYKYRTTLIRVHGGEDRNWFLVELSEEFMRKEDPFGYIEGCLVEMGGLECEILNMLGITEHGVESIGVLLKGEGEGEQPFCPISPRLTPEEQMDVESPPGLQEGPRGGPDGVPPEYEIQEEAQLESVRIYDDFEVTAESKVKDLRTACAWLGISQSGGKQRLLGRIREAHVTTSAAAAIRCLLVLSMCFSLDVAVSTSKTLT